MKAKTKGLAPQESLRMPEYRAMTTPVLVMPGEQDRAIPLWVQRKIVDVFPNARWLPIPDCGHVAYLKRPEIFFPTLKAFLHAKDIGFLAP